MITRPIVIVAVLAAFIGAVFLYDYSGSARTTARAPVQGGELVRPHSPVIGPAAAPVTIVEFFDPSCEACAAFHPLVQRILALFPQEVRLVLRYTPFHEGSDEAVRMLETARLQGRFEAVLEALLARQAEWAVHGAPDLGKAWDIAAAAGLDVARARDVAASDAIERMLRQDVADAQAFEVQATPTFFVNTKPLPSFGAQQLYDLVESEVRNSRAGAGSR
jgi:protein-disulfide isomerase